MTTNDDQEKTASLVADQKDDDVVGDSGSAEAAPDMPPGGEIGQRGPADHTAESAENQDKRPRTSPASTSPKPTLSRAQLAIDRRISDIEQLLIEKEAFQMAYVFQKIPLPYYNQWKSEGNEIVALIVGLKHRAKALRKRKAG